MNNTTQTVGLTGGIASGKTAVSDAFAKLGVPVIDADVIAREVVEPNTPGLQSLINEFGTDILDGNSLDRRALRKQVFGNPEKLEKLNSLLHPLIRQEIQAQIEAVTTPYCVVVIPLLCESSEYQWLDRILVVDVTMETQIKRLMDRDQISSELANKMIASQCNREQRLLLADDVIRNESSLSSLIARVEVLDANYKQLFISN